jgi:hypothetical protein
MSKKQKDVIEGADWFVVYDCEDGDGRNVMTINGDYAKDREQALEEVRRSFSAFGGKMPKVLLMTQDADEVPDDLDVIDLDSAEEALSDPAAISRPERLN